MTAATDRLNIKDYLKLRNCNPAGVNGAESISLTVFQVSCEAKKATSVVDSTHTTWHCVPCQIKKAGSLDKLHSDTPSHII